MGGGQDGTVRLCAGGPRSRRTGLPRVHRYEVLAYARDALGGKALVLASLCMTTAEVVFEFAAAALTPRAFRALRPGARMDARSTAAFALDAYGCSSLCALVASSTRRPPKNLSPRKTRPRGA